MAPVLADGKHEIQCCHCLQAIRLKVLTMLSTGAYGAGYNVGLIFLERDPQFQLCVA